MELGTEGKKDESVDKNRFMRDQKANDSVDYLQKKKKAKHLR